MSEAEKGTFMHFKMWLCKSSFLLAIKSGLAFFKKRLLHYQLIGH